MKSSIVIFMLMLAITPVCKSQGENDKWSQDLHFLEEQMQKIFPEFYSRVPKELLDKTVNQIETKIPQLSKSDFVMELFRLTALPNDAHTIPFVFDPVFSFHDFPIKIFHFEEGWYIIDAENKYKNLVGTKILNINSCTIEDLYRKFTPYLAAENEYARLERFTYICLMSEWLKSQGVTDNLTTITITVEEENGEKVVKNIDAIDFSKKFKWSFLDPIDNRSPAVFLNPRNDSYWFEYNENSKTIYFQFNKVENQKGKETIAEFTKRLEEFVETHDFYKFIVDIRNNIGGNDVFLKPIIKLIRDNVKINRRNRLFVLTGRHTFSSAVLFAYQLQLQTKAIFIGEPTAQGPVFCGNPAIITLPNSKLVFTIASTSTARTQAEWPFITDNKIEPDVLVKYKHDDFLSGKDIVMETAFMYQGTEGKSEVIQEALLDKYTGRYLLSQLQVLDVKRNGNKLTFVIDDFSPANLFRVQSDLYGKSENEFDTDNKDVSISFIESDSGVNSLTLSWRGQKKILNRAPVDFTTIMELLLKKRYDAAYEQISLNKVLYTLDFIENPLVLAGYDLLNQNKIPEAVKIFRLAVELFPESWNAYDSLGEGYMKAGNKEFAIENYEKSIKLNPNNKNAIKIVTKLKHK